MKNWIKVWWHCLFSFHRMVTIKWMSGNTDYECGDCSYKPNPQKGNL